MCATCQPNTPRCASPTHHSPTRRTGEGDYCSRCSDPNSLWTERTCIQRASHDAEGSLSRVEYAVHPCENRCETFKTDHLLRLAVYPNSHCEGEFDQQLAGDICVRRLVTAFEFPNVHDARGAHAGEFRWVGNDVTVEGCLWGVTNAGTHRAPASENDCEECHAPGTMIGQLCGRVIETSFDHLHGCEIRAAYYLRFEATELFEDTGVVGTIEGVTLCPCSE